MTTFSPAQRAAEEFDSVLDGTASRTVADRHADLLATVELLRTQPEVLPRADFVASLRARLMTAAETELAAASPTHPAKITPLRRRNRRLGTVAASLVIVGGSAGMAAAAAGALPGETLYPLKRAGEEINAAVRIGEQSKGKALLGQAENRLDEIEAMMAGGSPDEAMVTDGVDAFRSSADEGSGHLFVAYNSSGDTEDIRIVRTFAAEQMATITQLAAESDAGTANLLVDAADTLADIDQQALVLCGGCGPEDAVDPPAALSEGAAAASVENLIARPAAQAEVDVTAALQAARAQQRADQPRGQLPADALAALKSAAEQRAGETPRLDAFPSDPGKRSGGGLVRSTITTTGELVPAITDDTAVSGLLTGVTGTLDDVTDGVPPVGEALDETTDQVEGLLP